MFGNYTQEANSRCFQVSDYDIYTIWDTIESFAEDETAKCWREKCEAIAYEYSFSSRFALMRILYSRAEACDLCKTETNTGFTIIADGREYVFSKLGIEQAESIDEKELKQYELIFNEIAARQPDADPEEARYLIAKALRDVEEAKSLTEAALPRGTSSKERARRIKESKTLLSRHEAFKLGHMLEFSLEEMSWFLLRVFDFEDGFRYNSSNDLIEAYGFLVKTSWQKVEELKKVYLQQSEGIMKSDASERAVDWTQCTGDSLAGLIHVWAVRPDECEHKFMDWLVMQASCLDLPSRTATRIYQKIASYVYEISAGIEPAPDRTEFIRRLRKLCGRDSDYDDKRKAYLYVSDESVLKKYKDAGSGFFDEAKNRKAYSVFDSCLIDGKKCKELSAQLLEKNKNLYTSAPDRAKAWRTVSSDENGLPRLIMAGRPDASRSRVQELLMGALQVEKGDMLHLLWYGFNLCWEARPIQNDMFDLQCALADFTETVGYVLNEALLPAFYPPHIMEQSMMLSIIISVEDVGVPAYNYAALCESLIKPRNRKKK